MEQKKKRKPSNTINGSKKGAVVSYFMRYPGTTLQEISDKFGVHKSTISNWVTARLTKNREKKR